MSDNQNQNINNLGVNSPLSKPTVVADILRANGIDPKYSFGQNFLVNDRIIGKILHLADIKSGDCVVEIGPGLGVLTIALLLRGARVLAIEKDRDMVDILNKNVERFCPEYAHNLHVKNIDALQFDFADASKHFDLIPTQTFKFVSNLPYAIAATIILDAFAACQQLASAVVMVQKEVAQRIAASSGNKNFGAYTVKLSMYSEFVEKFDVSPNNFFPAPRVVSSVVKLAAKQTESPDIIAVASAVAEAAFSHRRKTISNSVKQYCLANPRFLDGCLNINNANICNLSEAILQAIQKAGFDLSVRAEALSSSDYIAIAKIICSK